MDEEELEEKDINQITIFDVIEEDGKTTQNNKET